MPNQKNGDVTVVTPSHSYYRFSLSGNTKRVKETVDQSPIPITPLEISQKTGIKHATVRRCLIRLARKGFVEKPYYGYYVGSKADVTLKSSMVKGGCDPWPRLHSLRLRASGLVGGPCDWRRNLGMVNVTFQRHKNGSGTVFVGCVGDSSLDYVSFRLLLEAMREDLGLLGITDWKTMRVSSFEFNNDFQGVQLDGVKAVTLKAFDGSFRRLYNKRFGLRDEVKATGPRRVEDVLLLIQGGVSTYSIFQFLVKTHQQLKIQNKFQDENMAQNRRLF
ncbi:MarR family transcriptional regulator, partial [Candidatus Bathyarchaeota archaeon A05DMB-2]|nr:MarR family transcriptional regulator [Candidatus Bathyarchaeota archaeon A05DMB-2]